MNDIKCVVYYETDKIHRLMDGTFLRRALVAKSLVMNFTILKVFSFIVK